MRLKNGVPHESVLAPLLFNIYASNLPPTTSTKFSYADDLALVHIAGDWRTLKKTLSQDMATLQTYLQKWRLKLSETKTVSSVFHLQWRTHGGVSGVQNPPLKILKEMKTSLFGTNRLFSYRDCRNCSRVFLCYPTCL